jgi:uncharacterized protein (TIGR02271 family)
MIRREQQTSSPRQSFPDLPEINLERITGYNVYGKNHEHIGRVSAIWTDQSSRPAYLGIKTSWLMGKTHVVPAYGATVNPQDEMILLPYLEEDVKNAPSFDPEAELDFDKEREVHTYYRERGPHLPELEREETSATMQGEMERQTPPEIPRRETARTAQTEQAGMALHEEQLKVGKRQVEMGGVRLRKIVRTETVNQPVELRREEVVVERVPAHERSAGEKAFQNEELFIPLWREEPVVEKETRVREKVQARKTAETERRDVSGEVRREDVEIQKETQHHHAE